MDFWKLVVNPTIRANTNKATWQAAIVRGLRSGLWLRSGG